MRQARASSTARLIAAATVLAGREGNLSTFPPPEAVTLSERLLSTTRSDRLLLLFTARSAIGRRCWRFIERLTIPGILDHWMLRKETIERLARQAAREGFTQLVIIGAGLDTLAFRMNAERVFESVLAFDHPATQAVVREAVGGSLKSETNIELVAVDLQAEDFSSALGRSRRFDAGRPTLFVIEGVLMYLPEQTVRKILWAISGAPCPRLRLIATYMDAIPGQASDRRAAIAFRPQSPIVAFWLRVSGEAMLWSVADVLLSELLAGTGWRLVETLPITTMDRSGRANARGPDGENIFIGERTGRQRETPASR